jgi:hypothetical protein
MFCSISVFSCHGAFRRVRDPPFWAPPPRPWDIAKQHAAAARAQEKDRKAPDLKAHGGDRRSDQGDNTERDVTLKRGNSPSYALARPLKVLIPLIQGELQLGNSAGHENYTRAGEMLIEAREQVGRGAWPKWLSKNFDLSRSTAYRYMAWAERAEQSSHGVGQMPKSLRDMEGSTQRRREEHQSKQQQSFRRVLRDVARDDFVQERQARDGEIKLHRELAEELIDIGYRALATRLHPDAPVSAQRVPAGHHRRLRL